MPPGPFHRSKANANPLRKSTPLRRAGMGANGSGSGPARRPTNAPGPGSGPNASQNGSALSSSSTESASNLSNYKEFSLRCTTIEEVRDLRHHIMKFHSRTHVDPAKTFTAPVRLHRKDPRNMQNQLTLAELEDRRKRGIPDNVMEVDVKEEDDVHVKAESADGKDEDKKKAAEDKGKAPAEQVDLSLIAPDGGARRAKINPFQKKTRQVILGDEGARKLRYEEHYPWVMEDFDGKNTWVGNYEAGQAESFVLFMFDANGFKMVPAEKYYKMTPRNKYHTLSAEEAEKRMQKGEQQNRWAMRYFAGDEEESKSAPNMRRRFRTTDKVVREEDSIRRDEDQEEIDFDEEFADDEEAPIMDGNEEEVKEVEKKVKKELRNDNTDKLFEESDEDADKKMDKTGLKLIKSLRSLEKNGNYDSDEDVNPYATEESSDSEHESEAPVKEEDKDKDDPAKGTVSSSAPGAILADVRKEKKEKKLKKDKLKNKKKKRAMNLPPGMVVLQLAPNVLSDFPSNVWNPNLKRRRVEEVEGSDGVKGPKLKKIKVKSEPVDPAPIMTSPSATVAKSPSPPAAESSRQQSPASPGSPPKTEPTDADLLTEEDVVSIIRTEKVTAKQLLRLLKPKLRKHPNNNALLKGLVSRVARLVDGVLVLKDQ